MKKDFKQQIQDIFGTIDTEKLREISEAAKKYDCMAAKSAAAKSPSGRKNSLPRRRWQKFWHCRIRGRRLPVLPENIRFRARLSTARSGAPTISVMILM